MYLGQEWWCELGIWVITGWPYCHLCLVLMTSGTFLLVPVGSNEATQKVWHDIYEHNEPLHIGFSHPGSLRATSHPLDSFVFERVRSLYGRTIETHPWKGVGGGVCLHLGEDILLLPEFHLFNVWRNFFRKLPLSAGRNYPHRHFSMCKKKVNKKNFFWGWWDS